MTNSFFSNQCMPSMFMCDVTGKYRVIGTLTEENILQAATVILEKRFSQNGSNILSSPQDMKTYFTARLSTLEHEVFSVLFLDIRNRMIAYEQMFRGSIASTSIHVREVVKMAIQLNAAHVVLAHNHPSGCVDPSRQDEIVTDALIKALALVDVQVLDHIVVAGANMLSFAENGIIKAY